MLLIILCNRLHPRLGPSLHFLHHQAVPKASNSSDHYHRHDHYIIIIILVVLRSRPKNRVSPRCRRELLLNQLHHNYLPKKVLLVLLCMEMPRSEGLIGDHHPPRYRDHILGTLSRP